MQNQVFTYDEVKSQKVVLASAQPDTQIEIAGNNAFDRLKGYMLIITKADGTPYTGNVDVSVATSQGFQMLPKQPYHCIRPSFMERFLDRIIKVDEKGNGQDFRFRVEANNVAEPLHITAVAYFTRRK
jgi:hypothetical protein